MEVNEQRAGNRMILLLIAGIPVMVILIATWLWYYVVQGDLDLVAALGTSNSGTLVQPPRELQDVDLVEGGALPFRYGELDPKWSFVIPGVASCDLICEKSLYTTRQIHIALGKEFNRIRRVYVSDTASADTALDITRLTDDHPPRPVLMPTCKMSIAASRQLRSTPPSTPSCSGNMRITGLPGTWLTRQAGS